MSRTQKIARAILQRIARLFGLIVLAEPDVKAARKTLVQLQLYAFQSGALQHPRRVKARSKIIAACADVLVALK